MLDKDYNGKIYVYMNKRKYIETGKKSYYVGQTVKSIEARAGKDGNNYVVGHEQCKFARAINKWGWDSFEIVELIENINDPDELNKKEIEYINKYNSYNEGYNSTIGGEGQRKRIVSEESRRKMSESHKGKQTGSDNPMYGVKMSDESRRKMSEAKKGKPSNRLGKTLSEEHKQKLRDNAKNNDNYGRKGKLASDETKRKMSEANAKSKKPVYCNELGMEFECIREAQRYMKETYDISVKNITAVCNGKRNSDGTVIIDGKKVRLTWKFVTKEDTNRD